MGRTKEGLRGTEGALLLGAAAAICAAASASAEWGDGGDLTLPSPPPMGLRIALRSPAAVGAASWTVDDDAPAPPPPLRPPPPAAGIAIAGTGAELDGDPISSGSSPISQECTVLGRSASPRGGGIGTAVTRASADCISVRSGGGVCSPVMPASNDQHVGSYHAIDPTHCANPSW